MMTTSICGFAVPSPTNWRGEQVVVRLVSGFGCGCVPARPRFLVSSASFLAALSRLKQGFNSPRERHQINGLVGVYDAALWQWTTRWTSPSGIFTPKSVELISRCADPPLPPPT